MLVVLTYLHAGRLSLLVETNILANLRRIAELQYDNASVGSEAILFAR